MSDFDTLNEQGLAERGDLLGDKWEAPAPAMPFTPPTLDGAPTFPEPGIYFGMPDEIYHAIHAVSTSGLKHLSVSSMDYWANSVLNPDRDLDEDGNEKDEKPHFNFGKAIHCFVLEGEDCYTARYAVDLDPADFKDEPILFDTASIKSAIGKFHERVSVKPVGGKQDLIDQLAALIAESGLDIPIPDKVDGLKDSIRSFTTLAPVKPWSKVTEGEGEDVTTRAAVKEDWIDQLLALDPEARVWDRMVAEHRAANPGKLFVTARTDRRVRIAAKMILAHPEIKELVKGGYPEVSIFWYCRATGVPMKARLDYLKLNQIVDLKSFGNRGGMPIDRAIERTIASYRYNLQHVIYDEAVEEAKRMVSERYEQAVFHCDKDVNRDQIDTDARDAFSHELSQQEVTPEFVFIFQQTGVAPVTRGKRMPREGMGVFGVTRSRAELLKRKWIACAEVYGTDPWLDIVPIDTIDDENIPLYATEI